MLSEYTATVSGGVHSAYIDSHYVYLTDDAPRGPSANYRLSGREASQGSCAVSGGESHGCHTQYRDGIDVEAGAIYHDLQVKDGIAYLAYWRDGLVILDVGNGVAGGSPENPKLVSQYHFNHYELYGDGWLAGTHSVFRYKNYLFVGDEVFPAIFNLADRDRIPVRAICHVMDMSDIKHPKEVAQYEAPEKGSSGFLGRERHAL